MFRLNYEVRELFISSVLEALKSDGYSAKQLEKTRKLLAQDDEFLKQMFLLYCMEEK